MDELDALIDSTLSEMAADTSVAVAEPPGEDAQDSAFEPGAEAIVEADAPAVEEEGFEEQEAPAAVEAEPEVTPIAQAPGPSPEELQQRLLAQQEQIARYQQWQQQEQARQQIAALRAQWAEMDPDDAKRAELEFVAGLHEKRAQFAEQQLYRTQAQIAAEREAAAEAAAKPQAIGRAIAHYGLAETDRDLLETAQTAEQLDALAQRIKARNTRQTQAARTARAEQLKANPALKGGGGGEMPAAPEPPKNINELIDSLFD